MTTIIVFGISLLLSVLLLALKAIELKYGKKNIILELLSKLDQSSTALITGVKFRVLQFIQTVRYIFLVRIKEVLSAEFEKLRDRVGLEYRLRHELIMGRKEISNRGAVSFYLKKIAEEKPASGAGKIEESL